MRYSLTAQQLHDAVENRIGPVSRATVPLYSDNGGRPIPNGSAVLLRAGEVRFALTAAHVADQAESLPLFTGAGDALVRFEGSRTAIKLREGQSRLSDQLDVAVLTLSATTAEQIADGDFIDVSDIDTVERTLDDEIFLVAGYPGTKRKEEPALGLLEVGFYPALAVSRPRPDYKSLGLKPNHHLLLGFSKKRMWRRGVRVIAPDLYEMSGCGVWAIGEPEGALFERPRLTALLIGKRLARGVPVLQTTRMSVVMYGVVAALKSLGPANYEFE